MLIGYKMTHEIKGYGMKHPSKIVPMIIVEGNVGVGKSTFLNYLKSNLDIDVIYEPNQLWQDVGGHDLLEQFFLDPKRWAYSLQSYVLLTRIDQLFANLCDPERKTCLIERSIYSGRYCFAQVAKEIGWMNGLEWCLYKKLWEREVLRNPPIPSGFIYLRTPAQVCYDRIMHRGRFEERPISLDYLKRIEEKYENWFIHKHGVDEEILSLPVLVLDFTQDLSVGTSIEERHLQAVRDFVAQINKVS